MRIFFTGKNYAQGLKNNDPASYASVAKSIGHVCVDSLLEDPDVLICVDYSRKSLRYLRRAKSLEIRCVLICCEPSVVLPQNHQSRIAKFFDEIIWVGRSAEEHVKWPQSWRLVNSNSDRFDRAIMVNADKWSFIMGQLYWLRAGLANSENRLDTAGQGWNQSFIFRLLHRVYELLRTLTTLTFPNFQGLKHIFSLPKHYLGTPVDKVDLMSKYKVAVVIENSLELMTEKLFDAWFAGCIPVYVGPSVASFGLPENLVIPAEPNLISVSYAIDKALSENHEEFLGKIRNFLDESIFREWNSRDAIKRIIDLAT